MPSSWINFSYEVNELKKPFPPAICLMGPTASGKSAVAIYLAKTLGCEIVSVDSVMVYRGMDIGTAKPSLEDRQGVPHHLIDILDPAETFSAGRFRENALTLVNAIYKRGKIPLLAGGTMLYFQALLQGLAALPTADSKVRQQIEDDARKWGWHKMHESLAQIDPIAAKRIHRNDPQRIQRALEVFKISGRSLTDQCQETAAENIGFDTVRLIVGPADRETLHRRIEIRFLEMLDHGLIEEVQYLRRRGDLHSSLPSLRAVGYRQVWAYLNGKIDKSTMIERAIIATRQLAKRQITWLRKESTPYEYKNEKGNLCNSILKDLEPLMR